MKLHQRPSTSWSSSRTGCSGFSLIELLGAMTVLTILALALAPVLVREYDRSARDRETRSLESIAGGLRSHILRTRSIPSHTAYAQAIATEMGIQVSDVILNGRRQPRVFLVDPAVTNTIPIPYTQTHLGLATNIPVSLGMVMLSSVGTPLPAGLVSGFASSSTAFSNIWAASENAVPSGWSWSGKGEDLRIVRINLGTLFVPLALNYDAYTVTATNRGRFTVDRSATNTLPTLPTFVSNYLISTVVGLHHHAGVANTLQFTVVLQTPTAFIYQGSSWRGQTFHTRGSTPTSAIELQAAHDLFVSSPANDQAQGNPQVTPAAVIEAMTEYLQAFVDWRDNGYPSQHNTLDNAQDELDDVTSDLLHHASDADGNGNSGNGGNGGNDDDDDDDDDSGGGCDNDDDDWSGGCDDDDDDDGYGGGGCDGGSGGSGWWGSGGWWGGGGC
ncbi:MAG: type II secretion system protein [Verrucomicrobiales bacterium]|nr:type II secretion system protein [Verrucomicrobiales bacterium]